MTAASRLTAPIWGASATRGNEGAAPQASGPFILAMNLGAGRKDRNDVLDMGVGIRVLIQVGQRVAESDLLIRVYAKDLHPVVPEPYRATLAWSDTPLAPTPWLLASFGCCARRLLQLLDTLRTETPESMVARRPFRGSGVS